MTGRTLTRLLPAGAIAIVLAFLVTLSASWNLSSPTGGTWPWSLVPEDPSVTLDTAMGRFLDSQGAEVAEVIPQADGAARYNPIDGRVFLLHGYRALQSSPENPPFELLEASRAYSPRLRETRALLLESYGKSGRPEPALAEANALTTLLPTDPAFVVDLTAEFILQEHEHDRMAVALAKNPLRGRIMVRLAERRADPAVLEALVRHMRGLAKEPRERVWIGAFARFVAGTSDADSVRRMWAVFHDVDPAGVGKQVYDPEFTGLVGTPPFGWDIGRTAVGIGEIRDGALEAFYYGRREGALASQLLQLDPGAYSLHVKQEAADGTPPAGLTWQVECRPGRRALVRFSVVEMIAAGDAPVQFAVPPEGCAMQTLRLVGTPAEPVRRQSATIQSVRIERTGP